MYGVYQKYDNQQTHLRQEGGHPKTQLLLFICILIVTKLDGNEMLENKDNDGMHVR